MMKMLSRHIFVPLLEGRVHGNTFKCLRELQRTQWLTREEIQQLQQERLQALIAHAYENVPYYRRIFQERGLSPSDIKTTGDLTKLPVLTRQDVRDNFDDLIAINYTRKEMKLSATGGTTGEPLQFFIPKDTGWSWGAWYRGMGWYGFEPGDKYAEIWSHPYKKTILMDVGGAIGRFCRRYILQSALKMSEEQLALFVNRLRKFRPKALIAYPSAAYVLAEYIKQTNVSNLKFEVVVTTGEKLYDHHKQTIKEAFNCDVFEYYGGGEVLSIAYECQEHHKYHITAENVILEFLRDGKLASPGETGSIVVTDLHNYVMPFIRYQNGDLGVSSNRSCACGRGIPLLESVEGRITDVIVYKGGFISSPILTTIFKNLPVKQYQIVQEELGEMTIKIVRADGYSTVHTDYIVDTIHKYAGKDIKIDIQFVDLIPLTNAGKRKVVISKVPVRFR